MAAFIVKALTLSLCGYRTPELMNDPNFATLCANTTQLPASATLMTFNVRTSLANDPCPCACWRDRQAYVKDQVLKYNPDLFGLQETSHEQKATFDTLFKDMYASIGKDATSYQGRAGEINAIYYNTKHWEKLSDGMVWLGPDPSRPSAAWGMQYYRTAVFGRFRHTTSGRAICVFNTHYETPGNDRAQVEGAKVILNTMQKECRQEDVVFLMGDMNAPPQSAAMQFVYTNPVYPLKKTKVDGQGTWCNNMFDPLTKCVEEFDHILYHSNNKQTPVCVREAKAVRDEYNRCHVTDHALVVSKVDIGVSCDSPLSYQDGCAAPEVGIDYRGLDIAKIINANAEDCCDLCKNEPKCNAYTYSQGTCHLKRERGGAVPAAGVISARVPKCGSYEVDTDYAGKDLLSFSTFLVDDCCAMCRQVNGCEAFSWVNNVCYLKSTKGSTKSMTGAVSGTVR